MFSTTNACGLKRNLGNTVIELIAARVKIAAGRRCVLAVPVSIGISENEDCLLNVALGPLYIHEKGIGK